MELVAEEKGKIGGVIWGQVGGISRGTESKLFYIYIYLFIYSVVLTLSCGMFDLVPQTGIEPIPLALGSQSLNHWTTREVPVSILL